MKFLPLSLIQMSLYPIFISLWRTRLLIFLIILITKDYRNLNSMVALYSLKNERKKKKTFGVYTHSLYLPLSTIIFLVDGMLRV